MIYINTLFYYTKIFIYFHHECHQFKNALIKANYNRIISDCIFRFYKHNYIIEKVLEKKKVPNSVIRIILGFADLSKYYVCGNSLVSIEPFVFFKYLNNLDLSRNYIEDLSPISKMTRLTSLKLTENNIQNILPISNIKHLKSGFRL